MNTTQNTPQLCSRFGKILAAAIMLQFASLQGNATIIDYRSSSFPADLVTSSYNYGGVTVTGGPGLLFVNVSNGLSIFGDNQYAVDAGEFIDFMLLFMSGPQETEAKQNDLVTTQVEEPK